MGFDNLITFILLVVRMFWLKVDAVNELAKEVFNKKYPKKPLEVFMGKWNILVTTQIRNHDRRKGINGNYPCNPCKPNNE
ncbi:Uncharacterized protein TCM_027752 [Theobroma cacao]|uniref:Uncharacterized protein n=1 Tax=Theobroma cacao TaxID=3641 RepID=A0A061G8V0_THECC|nr:Uncharacterized protein TCM_027752 [Theobroma cacao]